MEKFYTPETFNQDKYKRTGWMISLLKTDFDGGRLRLSLRVATEENIGHYLQYYQILKWD